MRITSLKELNDLLANGDGIVVDHTFTHVTELAKKAEYIRDTIQNFFGEKLELKMEMQDRSDYAQLEIPPAMLNNPSDQWVEIRLSNRVPLVAISDES